MSDEDAERFDRAVRALTATAARRRSVAGLLLGLLAAIVPGRDPEAARRGRRQDLGLHAAGKKGKKRKKGKKGKKGNKPPVSPPISPPPANPCPQAAAPHFCASAGVCVPACASGRAFDAASCTCVCAQQRTCCSCITDVGSSCFGSAIANEAACDQACGDDPHTFRGGAGSDARCPQDVEDQCVETCKAELVCGTVNICKGLSPICNGDAGVCFQPLGGGPTRCGSLGNMCQCTSHQECVTLTGVPGAFCADLAGDDCEALHVNCKTFCVKPA